MIKKENKTIFMCADCGNESLTWAGKCSFCGGWNTLKEIKFNKDAKKGSTSVYTEPVKLSDIKQSVTFRLETKISEFDRVLGGGMVKGSLILFAGEPGIGKSTILSQIAGTISKTLYVSAEESIGQIKSRFDRLGIKNSNLKLICENDLDNIIKLIAEEKPELLIIDSIQTIASPEFPSTAGSLIQVKECALKLQEIIKKSEVTTVLVGHVTKGGDVAGPRTLEHLVDVVLYLEGERYHEGRILRGTKNRFGPTDEVGIFQITNEGLKEVKNPSSLFLAEMEADASGNAVAVTLEGTRPLLVEIQALVSASNFGYPKRTSSGYDLNRLNIIIALLNKRTGINLNSYDVYINLTGGLKIAEPAMDLAVAIAIASSYKNKPIPKKSCFYGELGLTGEIRRVLKEDKRQKEAKKMGFQPQTAKNIGELINKMF